MAAALPTANWNDAEILAELATVVANSLRVDAARVGPEATFTSLGAESLDLVEITLDVEAAFGVLWPEHHVLDVAREELGDGVVTDAAGAITTEGLALLQDRLPAAAWASLPMPPTVRDVTAAFLRIDVWVHVIRMLLEAAPRTCTTCGQALVLGSPARLTCRACKVEVDLPAGDDVNREWIRRWKAGR